MGEKGLDLRCPHLARVPPIVTTNIAARPIDIGLLGASGVVAQADGVAYFVKQARRRCERVGR